ncbi:hypothetical protein [Kribbella sp. NPDC051770]|uniref:hypothetical protein n=1 Tax=Kribbella sp. NPDC051770 TaxID=3155413 RepID=UPI00343260A1
MSRGSALLIGSRSVGDTVVVRPAGVLEVATAPQLRTYLLKTVADQPDGVIVLLQDLVLAHTYTLSVFASVARHTAGWSGVPLVLVIGEQRSSEVRMQARAVARFVPVFPDLNAALASVGNPPARQLSRLRLANDPHSGGVARRFVASTCELWHCEEVAEDAVAIVSELVGNMVRHAHSDGDLRLELRRELLTVAALATAWGTNPTTTGGKVVWATLRLRRPDARAAINNRWRDGQ